MLLILCLFYPGTKRKSGWSSLIKKVTETNASSPGAYKNSVLQLDNPKSNKDLDTLIDMNGFPTPMSAPLITDEAAYQEILLFQTTKHCMPTLYIPQVENSGL